MTAGFPCDAIAAFRAADDALDIEDFLATADCVDPLSRRVFCRELTGTMPPERLEALRATSVPVAKPSSNDPSRMEFAQWLALISARSQIDQLVAAGQVPPELAKVYCAPHPPRTKPRIVGAVEDGEGIAFVLYQPYVKTSLIASGRRLEPIRRWQTRRGCGRTWRDRFRCRLLLVADSRAGGFAGDNCN